MWKTIDSAPKDGTVLLLFADGWTRTGWWETNHLETMVDPSKPRWVDGSYNSYDEMYQLLPTHWMPLPDPPSVTRLDEPAPDSINFCPNSGVVLRREPEPELIYVCRRRPDGGIVGFVQSVRKGSIVAVEESWFAGSGESNKPMLS